nr:MAG TPA: hypothetical protein [Caudoviricetes sp.]
MLVFCDDLQKLVKKKFKKMKILVEQSIALCYNPT